MVVDPAPGVESLADK
ncbi:hypothetical protein L195_g059869, partial [Trifolium pratense]